MEIISLKPSRKLLTKLVLIFSAVSLYAVLFGVLLQILIPLDKNTSGAEVAAVLWPVVIITVIVMWLVSLPIVMVWFKNLSYEIKKERVTVYKGIISRIEQNIPYKAVTDFMLHRSLFDRFLGIASIKIQTAGQSPTSTGYEGVLGGLVNYNEIMEDLRTRLQRYNELRDNDKDEIYSKDSDYNLLNKILTELISIRKALESKD